MDEGPMVRASRVPGTRRVILLASSAYEEVPTTSCSVATDERGDPRPGMPSADCDAGAYEYQQPTISTTANPASGSGDTKLGDSSTLGEIYNLDDTGAITFKLYALGTCIAPR